MSLKKLQSVSVIMTKTQKVGPLREIVEQKPLADMTEKELHGILTAPGRVTQNLVRAVYAELNVRNTNQSIDAMRADAEFLKEVLDALTAEGKSESVARNLTDTEAKMLAQARRLGIV